MRKLAITIGLSAALLAQGLTNAYAQTTTTSNEADNTDIVFGNNIEPVIETVINPQLASATTSTTAFAATASTKAELVEQLSQLLVTFQSEGQITYTGKQSDYQDLASLLKEVYAKQPYVHGTLSSISYSAKYTRGGTSNVYTLTFHPQYLTTAEQEQYVNEQVASIAKQLSNKGMSDFEKVKAVNDYIVSHTQYNLNTSGSPHIIYTLLTEGEAVCQAYALFAYRLLKEMNMDAEYVVGTANGVAHAWNKVKVDGAWYNLDTTFNDPVFSSNVDSSNYVGYKYLLLSDAAISKDHIEDNDVPYATASSTKYDSLQQMSSGYSYGGLVQSNVPVVDGEQLYFLGKEGYYIDNQLYVANVTDPQLTFSAVSGLKASAFTVTDGTIYFVGVNDSYTIQAYNPSTTIRQSVAKLSKKVTRLSVNGTMLTAWNNSTQLWQQQVKEAVGEEDEPDTNEALNTPSQEQVPSSEGDATQGNSSEASGEQQPTEQEPALNDEQANNPIPPHNDEQSNKDNEQSQLSDEQPGNEASSTQPAGNTNDEQQPEDDQQAGNDRNDENGNAPATDDEPIIEEPIRENPAPAYPDDEILTQQQLMIQQAKELVNAAKKLDAMTEDFEADYAGFVKQLTAWEKQAVNMALPADLAAEASRLRILTNQLKAFDGYVAFSKPKEVESALKKWTLTLSTNIDASTSNAKNIRIVDVTGKQINAKVTISGKSITVVPQARYVAGQTYILLIDKKLKNKYGKTLKTGIQQRFIWNK